MEINGIVINERERVDDLHRKGYQIIQDPDNFCFGVDAVLLSGFARVKKQEKVLDLGSGTGILPILLEARTEGRFFYGLEIQEEMVEMSRRSVSLNALGHKIEIVHGDIKESRTYFKPSSFDVITTNPPYMNKGGGLINTTDKKSIARHELLVSLDEIISNTAALLKTNGRFYMIHRPHRLTDIMTSLRGHRLEPKTIRFVHPNLHKEPSMVLIEAIRNSNAMVKVLPPLVIYAENGSYTDEVYQIYYR